MAVLREGHLQALAVTWSPQRFGQHPKSLPLSCSFQLGGLFEHTQDLGGGSNDFLGLACGQNLR